MSRTTEILTREDFFIACPEELHDQMAEELDQWAMGANCRRVECTVDSLGRIDCESSPRPAD